MGPGPDFVHTVVECAKLAFADREAWYGDPEFTDVPLEALLSAAYADERRALVGDARVGGAAAGRAGRPRARLPPLARAAAGAAGTRADARAGAATPATSTSPTATATSSRPRPSGGWLHGAPIIPGLGFCLGTRAQMFWLTEGLPNSLEPRKRPRTTLTPTLVLRDGDPYMAIGTPGGDMQDQWSLGALLGHLHFDRDLQAAIDAPELPHQPHAELVPSARAAPQRDRDRGARGRRRRSTSCAAAATTCRCGRRGRSAA